MITYICKRRPDDGYSCVNLYAGKIKIAVENRVPYKAKEGAYRIAFLIPSIEPIFSDDQKQLRSEAIRLCKDWFDSANLQPEEATK